MMVESEVARPGQSSGPVAGMLPEGTGPRWRRWTAHRDPATFMTMTSSRRNVDDDSRRPDLQPGQTAPIEMDMSVKCAVFVGPGRRQERTSRQRPLDPSGRKLHSKPLPNDEQPLCTLFAQLQRHRPPWRRSTSPALARNYVRAGQVACSSSLRIPVTQPCKSRVRHPLDRAVPVPEEARPLG